MHSYLVYVDISLGNKMNFSLYANMAGFCSDGHILCAPLFIDTNTYQYKHR